MKNQYHLISFVLFLICVGARFVSELSGSSIVFTCLIYASLVLGIVFLALDSFKQGGFASVFVFKNRFHLNIFAIIASVGFFVDFVAGAVNMYSTLFDSTYIAIPPFIALCMATVMALLSSFYFVLVSSSFAGSKYDFRKLKVLHFAPLLWGISRVFAILDEAPSILQDDVTILKYTVLIFVTCAFFFFAFEVESEDGARKATVFFFRAFYYTGIAYFINMLILLLGRNTSLNVYDCIFALTTLFISGFVYFCEKNIINHTKLGV